MGKHNFSVLFILEKQWNYLNLKCADFNFYVVNGDYYLTHLCPMLHKRNKKFRHYTYNKQSLKPMVRFHNIWHKWVNNTKILVTMRFLIKKQQFF